MFPKMTKNVMWLKPYIMSVKHLVPINKISKVCGYSVPLHKAEVQDAAIVYPSGKKKAVISIRMTNNDYINEKQLRPYYAQVLNHLAHEMAHLKHFDHSPKHLELEARIMLKFAKVAAKLGVKDLWKRVK